MATTANAANAYSLAGDYDVELIVNSNNGCADTTEQSITLFAVPTADFAFDTVCAEETTSFTDGSAIATGNIDSYDWTFGNGAISALQDPSTVYNLGGSYTANLLVISDQGCRDSLEQTVPVFPKPVADFIALDACLNDPNMFSDQSTINMGAVSQWNWDFGNSSGTSTDQNPTYIYVTSGQYNVTLTTGTLDGCSDAVTYPVNVFDLPVADFSFTNVCEDDSARFMDQSTIPTGTINDWQWDLGNGNTPTAQTPDPQFYPADDLYPVSLIVSSGFGCSDTLEDVIEIYPVPIAEFTFDSVCFPLEVQFTDLSDPNGTYAISNWQWTFSDGQTDAQQSPAIGFAAAGTYSATLVITNGPGCKSTFADGDAVIHPVPVADFPAGLAVCLEDTIFFSDLSSIIPITNDTIDTWNWDFDDGTTSTLPEPFHLYTAANLYDVQFEVQTNNGCLHSVTKVVEIYPLPQVDFSATPEDGCVPMQVRFLDESSIPAPYTLVGWEWSLGTDSSTSTSPNPFFLYNPEMEPLDSVAYDIGLRMTSGNGCVSEILRTDYIRVHPLPDALFSVDEDVRTILKPVFRFTDLSTENVTLWDWDFGDATMGEEQHPTHTYPDVPDTYPIVLMVETDFGCRDTARYKVEVEPVFTFYIPSSFTPDNDGINDLFYGQGAYYTDYAFYIYDRWGELIFESADDQYHWDGTFKGEQVQQGIYVYRFYIIDWKGDDHEYKGVVTLHR